MGKSDTKIYSLYPLCFNSCSFPINWFIPARHVGPGLGFVMIENFDLKRLNDLFKLMSGLMGLEPRPLRLQPRASSPQCTAQHQSCPQQPLPQAACEISTALPQ